MKDEKQNDRIVELNNTREYYRTKAFHMMIEVAFIFGIPAAVAFFAGRKLDSIYGTGKTIILSLLAGAFVLSWIIVIIRYRKLDRELRHVDEEIKKEAERQKSKASINESE